MDTQTTPDTIQVYQKETTPATSQADQENTTSSENAATFEVGGNGYTFTEDELQKIENGQRPVLKQQTDEKKSIPSIWDNGFDKGMEANPDMTIYDAIRGYNDYAKENQKEPLDILDIWPLMQSGDIMKSKAQNEKDERKRANKEKWDQVTNALLHLGNFVGAIAGAPSQDIESSLELSKRQQMLRDKTLEQRRQANNDFLKVYQTSQAAKIAAEKEKREAAYQQRKMALDERKQEEVERKNAEHEAYLYERLDLDWQKLSQNDRLIKIREDVAKGNLSMRAADILIKREKLEESKKPKVVEKVDQYGNVSRITTGTGGGAPASPTNNGGSSSNRGNRGGQSPQITGVNWVN